MEELLLFLARGLVDDADAVSVTRRDLPDETVLELHVAAGDVGKVIGRGGRIVRSLRTVLRAAAMQRGERVHVEIAG